MPSNAEPKPGEFPLAVAAEIRRLLADRQLRAADVVRNTSLSTNYLSVRLRGDRSFTLTDIEILGDYLGFDPADFLSSLAKPFDDRDGRVTDIRRRRDVGPSTEDASEEPMAASKRGEHAAAEPEDT